MRGLAAESKQAYKHLGAENGQAFIGLVADFRAAFFVGDVPLGPIAVKRDSQAFQLDWRVSSTCILHAVVLIVDGNDEEAWEDSYRIRLDAVTVGKERLA